MTRFTLLALLLAGPVFSDQELPAPAAQGWLAEARPFAEVDSLKAAPGEPVVRLAFVATGSGVLEDANGALLPTRNGELDLGNFRVFRVTTVSPATGKLLRGEELGPVSAARVEAPGVAPTCDAIEGSVVSVAELDLRLSAPLQPDAVYAVYVGRLQHPMNCEKRTDSRAQFSTVFTPKAVADAASKDQARYVLVTSEVPIADPNQIALYEVEIQPDGKEAETLLEAEAVYTRSGEGLVPASFNSVRIFPKKRFKQGIGYRLRVKGLRSHLAAGDAKSADFVGKFGSPPKGKDDAAYYSKLYAQVAESQKPIFAADVKLSPDGPRIGGDWFFDPELEADVGSDTSKAKNRILLKPAFSLEKTFRSGALGGLVLDLAPSLETDRDFDKRNALLVAELEPLFRGWIRTRELKAEEDRVFKSTSVREQMTGYGTEVRFGAELGRSEPANDGLVRNKAKTQFVTVPDYDVARLRAFLRTFREWRGLVVELKLDYRYLFSDEVVADLNKATDTVALRSEDGLQGVASLGLAWVFDPEQHFALGVEYQRGESPPTYQEVDTAKLTLILKY